MRRTMSCLLVTGVLFLGGCGGGDSAPTASTGGSAPPGAPPGPPGSGPPAAPGSDGGSGGAGASAPPASPDGGAPANSPPPGEASPPSSGSPDGGLAGGQQAPGGEGGAPGGGFGFGGFGGFGGASGAPEAGGEPGGLPDMSALRAQQKSLREQAVDAYRVGDEILGAQLLMTHFAVMPGAEKELAEKMAWFTGLRRPALGPRFGVAVFYDKAPRDFEGSPMPIGSTELATAVSAQQQQQQQGNEERPRRGKQRNNDGGEARPAGVGAELTAGTPKGDLFFHTGELGTKFLTALEAKITAGEYGRIYQDIAEAVARPAQPIDPNNPGGEANNPGGGEGRAGFGGVPGEGVGGAAPGEAPAAGGLAKPLGMAIVWLGRVTTKEDAARAAEQAQVDYLVAYELSGLRPPKEGVTIVQNTTVIRITSVKKAELVIATKGLNNLAVAVARDKAGDNVKDDPVEKEVARAIEALDKVCVAAPLPALTPEQVKGRVASLVAEKPANPLPVIVEARLYVAKGLLPEADMQAAAISLLGEAEYARLVAKSPGSGIGQMLGSALSLPGMVNLVRGANAAGSVAGAGLRRPGASGNNGGEGQPAPRGRGLRGLLPF